MLASSSVQLDRTALNGGPWDEGSLGAIAVGAVGHQVVIETRDDRAAAATNLLFAAMLEPVRADTRARLIVERIADGWRVFSGDSGHPFEGSLDDVQWYLRYQVARLLMAARPDLLWLHAAGVTRRGAALLIVGVSGSGKSTMAARFLRRGCGYLGDELLPIDPQKGLVYPFAMAPAVRIESSRQLPAADVRRLAKSTVVLEPTQIVNDAFRVGSMVFPIADDTIGREPLSPARTALELLGHVVDGDRDRLQTLRAAAALASAAPAMRVGLADIDEAIGCAADHHDAAQTRSR